MKVEDVLALAKAGFTAEQITTIAGAMNPAPTPAPEPAPTPEPTPAPAPAPAPDFLKLLEAMQDLTQAVQSGAINNSNQPKAQTPEEILAHILDPRDTKKMEV